MGYVTQEKKKGTMRKDELENTKREACTHAYHTQRELEFHPTLSFHVKTNSISH